MDFSGFGHSSSLLQMDEDSTNSSSISDDGPHTSDSCYDGDISNSSTDYNLSIEEEIGQTSTLHRGFDKAATREAKRIARFYPTSSEETVFVGSTDSLIDRMLQSPRYEQWMVYGTSSDEYCFGQSSDNDTQDANSDIEIRSDPGIKRQKHGHELFHIYEREKRIEKELKCTNMSSRYSYTSYPYQMKKMKQKSQEALVDVRIIDFAHTTFVHGSTMPCNSAHSPMVHQGPDCGFLTGLDSLKRLLLEILTEG